LDLGMLNSALAARKSTLDGPLGESDYRRIWLSTAADIAEPALSAAVGGVYADRLAWVFAAGYQIAVREHFGVNPAGWLAYCASEDRSGELPGVSAAEADGQWRLNGFKTWVAACDHVDSLIVTVGNRPAEHFLIAASAAGVQLSAKPKPSFLADLSQGIAQFSDAVVVQRLEPRPGAPFHIREALAIYSAFCGFVMAGFDNEMAVRARSLLESSAPLWTPLSDSAQIEQLQSLDRGIQQLRIDIDECAGEIVPGWEADNRLISMYSRGIQKLSG
jgi:hypothetical protein